MDEQLLRVAGLLGAEAVEKLKRARVAVAGIGGVGSWCAEALCRSGVGALTLLDFDTVAMSNLNRQAEALRSTVGQWKTEALAARLRDIQPDMELKLLPIRLDEVGREALLAEGPDFVADCVDSVGDKCDLLARCAERGIPVISSMGTGGKRDAAQLRLDRLSHTHTDPLARAVRRELKKRCDADPMVVWSPEPRQGEPGVPGTLMWVPATAGLLMAQHIVLTLCEAET